MVVVQPHTLRKRLAERAEAAGIDIAALRSAINGSDESGGIETLLGPSSFGHPAFLAEKGYPESVIAKAIENAERDIERNLEALLERARELGVLENRTFEP